MKLPISWLNDYVKVNDLRPKAVADALLSIGFEVEEIIWLAEGIKNVVVGKIIAIEKHPDADKLKICKVDIGTKIVDIITGADNIKINDVVPVALDGATLPNGKIIKAAPLRGIMSYGMLCSGGELNLGSYIDGAEVNGILILPDNSKIGEDIIKSLELDEYILDVSLTANRPDCQSIYGLAREVAVILKRKLLPLELKYSKTVTDKKIQVNIEYPEFCSRYTGAIIDNIKIDKSPKWMQKRLFMCGIRPINNVVDITNYVLLEIGQPLHAFDINYINEGTVVVRKAKENETVVALDEKKYLLPQEAGVIADKNKAIAIAGIMGGENSGISAQTQTVFLESARFARGIVRTTSKKLGLRSDSSARFEKGVDYLSVERGRERALALFDIIGAGRVTNYTVCAGQSLPKRKIITTTHERICSILGISVPKKTITSILNMLDIETTEENGFLKCCIPLFREDIDNYTDLSEEVIRFYGYDKLKETLMESSSFTIGGKGVKRSRINEIKNLLCSNGYYETLHFSFVNPKSFDKLCFSKNAPERNVIKILNPLSEDYSVMRTELVSSMLETALTNLNRKNSEFRLFEIAKTYTPNKNTDDLPFENETLCFCTVGDKEDFYSIKSVTAQLLSNFEVPFDLIRSEMPYIHPGIGADIIVNNKRIGCFGLVHPSVLENYGIKAHVFICTMDIEHLIATEKTYNHYKPLPKFLPVVRDIALIADEDIEAQFIIKTIKNASELIEDVSIFDIYRGEQVESGKKSIAVKFKIVSYSHTLNDIEIQKIMNDVIESLVAAGLSPRLK